MECFEAVVVAGGQCCRLEAISDERNKHSVVNSQLPLECEVRVAPELVQRVEMLARFGQPCENVLVSGAVAAENDAKVLGMLFNGDGGTVCEFDCVVRGGGPQEDTLLEIKSEIAV